MRRMTRESTWCVHLPLPNTFFAKYTFGRQITNLSSLSKIHSQEIFLFFWNMREAPTWEKKKEKEKRGNREVVVVCMILVWFCHIFMSFFFLEFAQVFAICNIFMILLLLLLLLNLLHNLLPLAKAMDFFYPSGSLQGLWGWFLFLFFFSFGFCIVCCCKIYELFFPTLWIAWFCVLGFLLGCMICCIWWCCILQICEGRFFFLPLACMSLLLHFVAGLWGWFVAWS